MKTSLESKSCNLKGNQQMFLLDQNQVASCCSAYPEELDANKTIADYQLNWKQEQQLLTQGVELPGCKSCWASEDQGKLSYRLIKGNQNDIKILLHFSNLCNHMCSYCSPKYSSVWEESITTHGMFRNVSTTVKDNLTKNQPPVNVDHWLEQIKDYINSCDDNSVNVQLLGGEPLMQQRNLEKLLKLNSNKIKTLHVVTNLNPPTNKFLIWLLDNIDNNKLKITISLDASPEYNHVPRAGFDSERFLSNLELLQNKNINFNTNSVISVLSMFDFENFISWINTNAFESIFSKLNNPDCLNAHYVPLRFREKIWKKINHLTLDPLIVELLQSPDNTADLKLFEQYNYLSQYFERVDLDPAQINNELFVEYWTWLHEYINKKFKL